MLNAMAWPQGADARDSLQIQKNAVNMLNKQSEGQPTSNNPVPLGTGQGTNNPSPQKLACYKMLHKMDLFNCKARLHHMPKTC